MTLLSVKVMKPVWSDDRRYGFISLVAESELLAASTILFFQEFPKHCRCTLRAFSIRRMCASVALFCGPSIYFWELKSPGLVKEFLTPAMDSPPGAICRGTIYGAY
jgi:hypothetical protein